MNEIGFSYVWRQLRNVVLVLLVCLILLVIGLMIGYSFIGNGGNPLDVLNPSTWTSIIDKFTGR